jgi:Uma2 family endonuclease
MSRTTSEGLTLADLEAMPDNGHRYELLGGSIVVNAAPAPRHQRASGVLYRLLVGACPPGHEVFYAPVDLDLPGGQRVEPDLVIAPIASVGDARLSLPVLLVVELVSPSTAVWDTVAKRAAYAEAGIANYWMVDTRKGQERFTALSLPSGAREYVVAAERAEEIDAQEPVSISVPLSALFEPPS